MYHEPFREEGVTRKRDGRRTREGKTAETFCFALLVTFPVFSFFAPQSDTDRLPSFKEGSCRRRRLRGVATRQEVIFMSRSRYCFGLCRGLFCDSAARKHKPSSGRKVSRVSVTEGERGTERRQKVEAFRRFNGNPSPASRELPLHKGAMGRYDFRLCAQRKQKQKSRFQNRKRQKNKSRALSFSRLR